MTKILIQKTGNIEVIPASDGRLTVSVAINIRHRRSRKQITLPSGEIFQPDVKNCPPTPLQLALARGYRWLAMLESGEVKSLAEIARRERVDDSYVSRIVNLASLAPDMVAAILDESIPQDLTLLDIAVDPPLLWDDQRNKYFSGAVGALK